MRAKVEKIVYDEFTLFENGVFLKKRISYHTLLFGNDRIDDIVSRTLPLKLTLSFGGRKYIRSATIECPVDNEALVLEQTEGMKKVEFYILPIEFKRKLLELIPDMEVGFYLSEDELLSDVHNLLRGKFEYVHFRQEVEIDDCVVDGLAFVNKSANYRHAKIIGFEVKTNRDVFERLYKQINSYLTVCDEVYLVVESKEPPKDLPFYIGIIKVKNDVATVVRRATSLKHNTDVNDCWKTLLKNLCSHAGIKRDSSIIGFFDAFENMKRKLLWNKYVIGFHQTYVKDYEPYTDDEKRLLKCFFAPQLGLDFAATELQPEKISNKTLEDFFGANL